MACANPIRMFDKNTREFISQVPCYKCINCIIDRRSTIEDLCDEELFQKNYAASYLTVTYDDYHINWVNDWHGSLRMSLKASDATKFVKRIRSYMKRHKINSPLADPKFRYIVAGEYGDGGRPHLHFVFFGLDYRVCDKIFRECWKFGNQKLLPVEKGCFNYVASYLTKQVYSLSVHDTYDVYNLERPFFHRSQGLGSTLFLRQWDFITSHDYCYQSRKGVLRPLPQYYMRRYCLYRANSTSPEKQAEWRSYFPNKNFSIKEYNKFKHILAKTREENLIARLRKSNEPLPYTPVPDWWQTVYVDKAECDAAIKDYLKQELVSNDTVVEVASTPTLYDWLRLFVDPYNHCFRSHPMFPMYTSYRQVAYDLKKYGTLVPF